MPWRPLPRIAAAICMHPFHPTSTSDLPLQLGDELYIIEQGGKDGAWYRGYLVALPSLLAGLTSDKGQALEPRVFSGIFPRACVEITEWLRQALPSANGVGLPANGAVDGSGGISQGLYAVKPVAPVPMLRVGDEPPTIRQEPLVDEIASCLREWHSTRLHEVILTRQYDVAEQLMVLVLRLDGARRKLLHDVLTNQEATDLRQQIVWDLAKGNKLVGSGVIVRSAERNGRMLTADDSPIEISQLQADMSLLDHAPPKLPDLQRLRQLLVTCESTFEMDGKATSLTISIYRQQADGHLKQISEAYAIDISAQSQSSTKSTTNRATLFTDIDIRSPHEQSDLFFLVVRVFSNEPLKGAEVNGAWSSAQDNTLISSPTSATSPADAKQNRRSLMWPIRRKNSETMTHLSQHPGSSYEIRNMTSDVVNTERKQLKRFVGVGVCELNHLLDKQKEIVENLTIWTPDQNGEDLVKMEAAKQHAIRDLLPSATNLYSPMALASSIDLRLHPFASVESQSLIHDSPVLLQSIHTTPVIELTGVPRRPRNDIYLTVVMPMLPPGVMLSHPTLGNCALPNELDMRDLQITFEVRNASGARMDNSIFPTCNSSGHTAWRSTAIERGEVWNQTLRLAIRPEDVLGSHIVASLADASSFPFALCWMPLWENEAFAHDGDHSLTLFKYDEQTSNIISGRGAYLALPWSSRSKSDAVFGTAGFLQIRTQLCSTSFSQDPAVLALLMWREQRSRDIIPILKRAQFVPEMELVKLMPKLLNAIFEVMTEYGGNEEVEDLAFNLLVTVVGLVHDRRFDLQTVVDEYARTSFNYPFAFPALVRSFVRLLTHALNDDSAKKLRAAAKVGSLLLRFTVLAKQHQIEKEVGIGIKTHRTTVARDLQALFLALNGLMQNTAPILIGTKTLLIQNFESWLPELQLVLNEHELFSVSSKFIDSCDLVVGKLVLYKLVLINFISRADFLGTAEVRDAWQAKSVQWLAPYWGTPRGTIEQWREQIRLCCGIVATQSTKWSAPVAPWLRKLVDSYIALQSLPKAANELGTYSPLFSNSFPAQVKTVQHEPNYDEGLVEVAALLTSAGADAAYLPAIPEQELFDLIIDLLGVCNSILDHEAYPESWLSLAIYQRRAILQSLQRVSEMLITQFLPDPDEADNFPTELWTMFFTTLVKVLISKVLALETFPEQKRRAIWKTVGDVREMGASLLQVSWSALGWETSLDDQELYTLPKMGGYQVQYVPSLVGPVITLCLSVHQGLRNVAVSVLHTMIVSEWVMGQDLGALQGEVLISLDTLFRNDSFKDPIPQKLFLGELTHIVGDSTTDNALKDAVKSFIDVIDHLLDLLVVVYSATTTSEASHIMDTLRLMDFLRDMQKEDIYIAYVHRLADIQAKAGNFTEAGLALRLHAELYDWSTAVTVPATDEPKLPSQKSFERKEWIYFQMIKHFEEGTAWHHALDAYEELCNEYAHNSFDFAKLARAKRASAALYERISRGEKQMPRFFRVVYRGLGFPVSLRDKQFIFEGLPSDHTNTFTERLQRQFPLAQIIGKEGIDDYEGQYLSVIPVQPQKDLTHPVNRRPKVGHHIREHFMLANPRQFTITPRSRHASQAALKDSTVEKIVFTTAETFPTILRRSEIIKTHTTRLTPIQVALERTMRKTQELAGIESRVGDADKKIYKSFTEALNILIRPDSGGSVSEYWTLVQSSVADEQLPVVDGEQDDDPRMQAKLVDALRCALIDHALGIRKCLYLCGNRVGLQAAGVELAQGKYLRRLDSNTSLMWSGSLRKLVRPSARNLRDATDRSSDPNDRFTSASLTYLSSFTRKSKGQYG